MMTSKFLVAVATLTVALAGCTGRSPRPVQIDNERPGKDGREGPAQDAEPVGPLDEDIVTDDGEPAADDEKSAGGDAKPTGDDDKPAAGDETAGVDLNIEEAPLQSYGIETSKLDYKLTYAVTPKYEKSDKLQFTGGKATLALKSLPAGQRGDMVLELSTSGVLKARATVAGVTLLKGLPNRIEMRPEVINGATSTSTSTSTADATIDVIVGNGGGSTVTATGTSSTTATSTGSAISTATSTGSATGTQTRTGSSTGTATGTSTDPIQSWDGKSFQGNGRWSVRAVDG